MRVRLIPEAKAEFKTISQWSEDQRAGFGEEFIDEVIEAFGAIERHPQRYPRSILRTNKELRQCRLDRFPHSIIYQLTDVGCFVLAIAHPSRNPATGNPGWFNGMPEMTLYFGQEVTMQVNLKPELVAFVNAEVQSGRFKSADDLLEAALVRMMEEEIPPLSEEDLNALDEAEDQIERGEWITAEDAIAQLRAKYFSK
jgi:Arc/MetJ-type ribon-helix-helix transcriptional regulator